VSPVRPHFSPGPCGLLLLLLILAGCATHPAHEAAPTAADLASPRYAVWQIRGRVSLIKGEQGWHARLNWREDSGHYRLDLSGPLGQGAVRVEGDDTGVRLRTADGRDYRARDVDALVQTVTGWQFPVAGIRYWVRGVPVPGEPAVVETDASGRLVRLVQSGWEISYDRFRDLEGRAWPTDLHLTTDDISVRLLVAEWTLGNAPAAVPAKAASDPSP
jgi:outer membrane lipoprotein LolB